MEQTHFRKIPGYGGYCVNEYGTIISIERNISLSQYFLNGYLIVDTFRGSITETLPIHRAVALAWCHNPDPSRFKVVNHIDGNKLNNYRGNLEWTDYSGNNYHAVNSGLRSDNIACSVRVFETGDVYDFSSIAQAAEFMGLRKDTRMAQLRPKKFGALVNDRFEFRVNGDNTPWFYESREARIKPSRYIVRATEKDGTVNEMYSYRELLKRYQLYGSSSNAVPALVDYGRQLHPDVNFDVRDSYEETIERDRRSTKPSIAINIRADKDGHRLVFKSLTQAAKHFKVDRSSIINRLDNGKELDGWTFTQLPH